MPEETLEVPKNSLAMWIVGILLALSGFGGRYIVNDMDGQIADVRLHVAAHDKDHAIERRELEKELAKIREELVRLSEAGRRQEDLLRYQFGIPPGQQHKSR